MQKEQCGEPLLAVERFERPVGVDVAVDEVEAQWLAGRDSEVQCGHEVRANLLNAIAASSVGVVALDPGMTIAESPGWLSGRLRNSPVYDETKPPVG